MKTFARLFAAVATLTLVACAPAEGQVSYDESTGLYTVMVYNDAGTLVPMMIPSPGRVRTGATGTVTGLPDGRFRYRWVARVNPDSPDPLGAIWVPCPEGAQVDDLSFVTTRTRGNTLEGVRQQESRVQHCQFAWRVDLGDSLQFEMVTNYLPAFGEIRAQGFVRGASWPTSDPTSRNNQFVRTVDSLSGLDATGVYVAMPSVVPIRPPSAVSQPDVAINVLLSDLGLACDRQWIAPRGICQSLEAKLTSVRRSLASRNLNSARAQLQAFRQEVSNQDPNHISPEAASVLLATATKLATLF